MILRPPKNFNEYSVSVPMSIDWMLKTLHKLVNNTSAPTLDQVTTAGNTTTNSIGTGTITGNSGISQFKFNTGAGGVTPTIAVGNTNTSGKFAALLAGTAGAEFNFDMSGWFAIAGDTKANYNSNNLGSGSETYYLRIEGSTGNVGIGTGTPTVKLDVNGDINTSSTYKIGGVSGYTGTFTVPTNPPGQQNLHITGGIITSVD